jgi:hypothetical protein
MQRKQETSSEPNSRAGRKVKKPTPTNIRDGFTVSRTAFQISWFMYMSPRISKINITTIDAVVAIQKLKWNASVIYFESHEADHECDIK